MKKFAFILAAFMLVVAPVAFAEDSVTSKTSGPSVVEKENEGKKMSEVKKTAKVEDLACTKTAVVKRETTLDTAFDTFTASMKSALVARKAALEAAYGQTDKVTRVKARNDAWKAFNTASKNAHKVMRDARKGAHATFKSEAKACGTTSIDSESKSESDKVNI
jgi:hypothetical protein